MYFCWFIFTKHIFSFDYQDKNYLYIYLIICIKQNFSNYLYKNYLFIYFN